MIKILVFLILITITPYSSLAGNPKCSADNNFGDKFDMGELDPYNYTNVILPITITIHCKEGKKNPQRISYTYSLGPGYGGVVSRKMQKDSDYINYFICTSSSCGQYYGDGTSGTILISNQYDMNPDLGKTDTWVLYIVVPVQPLIRAADYKDKFVRTFTYTY